MPGLGGGLRIGQFGYEPYRVHCVAVLCSWARLFILKVPVPTQVYIWIAASLMLRVTLQWTSIPSREGAEILLVGRMLTTKTLIQRKNDDHLFSHFTKFKRI